MKKAIIVFMALLCTFSYATQANAGYDVCVKTLEQVTQPISEYNCWDRWLVGFPLYIPQPECVAAPHCCTPGLCKVSPDCGLAKTTYQVVTNAGDLHCFDNISASELFDRWVDGQIALTADLLTGGLLSTLYPLVLENIDTVAGMGSHLPPNVQDLLKEIIEPIYDGGQTGFTYADISNALFINESDNFLTDFWMQKGAITLGPVVVISDADYNQLANPSNNSYDLFDVATGKTNSAYNNALSTVIHELVHVNQYAELGREAFTTNYLLKNAPLVTDGYGSDPTEQEAYKFEVYVSEMINGQFCFDNESDNNKHIDAFLDRGHVKCTTVADSDNDRILDHLDNCPAKYNPDQVDSDGDGVGNLCEAGTYIFQNLSAGGDVSCALGGDQSIGCWGSNTWGKATPPVGLFKHVDVGGAHHACAIREDGRVACWGWNAYGQSNPPATTFSQVSAGWYHSCGVLQNRLASCWGDSNGGSIPSTFANDHFLQIGTGARFSCGLRTNGTLACWGSNSSNQSNPPFGFFTQMSSGTRHSCALREDGTVDCWGNNSFGQISPPSGSFLQVSAGNDFTCAIRDNGALECWGVNDVGQSTPPDGKFKEVSAGSTHACAVRSNDTLVCWGENSWGPASGSLSLTPRALPGAVAGTYYRATLTPLGGLSPYHFDKPVGNLPPGLSLSPNGVISGVPATSGTYIFRVGVTDSWTIPLYGEQLYLLIVGDTSSDVDDTSGIIFPLPDIKANNTDGSLTVSLETPVKITAGLDSGLYNGVEADWWVLAWAPDGSVFSYVLPSWVTGIEPVVPYGLGLADFSNFELFNSYLVLGNFRVCFGVDLTPNLNIDLDSLYYDCVEIEVNDSGPTQLETTPPTVPGILTATFLSSSEIELEWIVSTDSGGSGLAGYKIERCTGSNCTNFTQIGASTTANYVDVGLSQETTYTYRVSAYDNANNQSMHSNTASATTPIQEDTLAPTVPGNLTATAQSPSEITLGWSVVTDSGNSGLSGYKIERCTGNGCTDFAQIGTSTGTGYTDSGLSADTTYTYRVRAYDNAGNNSGYSGTASATTPIQEDTLAPSVPGILIATPLNSSEIGLEWITSTDSGGSGLAGYKIERCTGSGCMNFTQIGTSTTAIYVNSGLTQETVYVYRVRAYDNAGNNSGYTNSISVTTSSENIPPTVPGNLVATSQGSSYYIVLNWIASTDSGGSGLAGYKIERCTGSNCTNFTQIGTSFANLNTDDGLIADTTYTYRVRAYDNAGNQSGYSNTAAATTVPDTTPPYSPQNLSATVPTLYGCDVELAWLASADPGGGGMAAGYKIERCGEPFVYQDCTNFTEIGNVTVSGYTPSLSYTECLSPGAYKYRVRAYDAYDNLSGYSNTASATVYEQPM